MHVSCRSSNKEEVKVLGKRDIGWCTHKDKKLKNILFAADLDRNLLPMGRINIMD